MIKMVAISGFSWLITLILISGWRSWNASGAWSIVKMLTISFVAFFIVCVLLTLIVSFF